MKKWTEEDLLIALNLYMKIPFGKLHSRNPIIEEVAEKMGRTPSSLSMKLTNFASMDPVLQNRGIKGLPGASAQDRRMWDEFQRQSAELGAKSEALLDALLTGDANVDLEIEPTAEGGKFERAQWASRETETVAQVTIRKGQGFFRQAVLCAFDWRCCVSSVPLPQLLVASHILPWAKFPNERLNLQNGLCLSVLHDAAFDKGFVFFDEEYRLRVGSRLRKQLPSEVLSDNFLRYEGHPLRFPEKNALPDSTFLKYHREHVFGD